MSDIKMNSKVWIIGYQKIDGRYNKGIVVGIDKYYEFLGFVSQKQFFRNFKTSRLKVAYIDVFTGKPCAEWFSLSELSLDKPAV